MTTIVVPFLLCHAAWLSWRGGRCSGLNRWYGIGIRSLLLHT